MPDLLIDWYIFKISRNTLSYVFHLIYFAYSNINLISNVNLNIN